MRLNVDKIYSLITKSNTTLEIEKSKFISYISPANSEEEAIDFINQIKKLNYNATHNVSAYILREQNNIRRYSDDGEPGGTAGLPTLNALIHRNLVDVCIVTTRYFGGVKLGAGGLTRAYAEAAHKCIEAADITEYTRMRQYTVIASYEQFNTIQYYLKQNIVLIDNTVYTENVELSIYLSSNEKDVLKDLINLTSSNIKFVEGEEKYIALLNGKIISCKEL